MHFFFTIDRTHIVTVVKLKIKFGQTLVTRKIKRAIIVPRALLLERVKCERVICEVNYCVHLRLLFKCTERTIRKCIFLSPCCFSFYYLIDYCQVLCTRPFLYCYVIIIVFGLAPCNVAQIRFFCWYFSQTCLTSDYYSAINRIGITVIRVWCQIQYIDVLVRTLNCDTPTL